MISVVIATYNGEKFILEQLKSIANQSTLPDEVVITDDYSTDNTLKLINEFMINSKLNITVLNNNVRLGYAKNFERGLLECNGDYVFLSDQDDVWYENKVTYMVSLSKRNPNYSCFLNDTLIVDSNLQPIDNITKIDQIKKLGLSNKSFVMGACCLLKREILDISLPFPIHITAHDNWIVEIANELNSCYVTDKVLQFYRRHDNNESVAVFNSTKPITLFEKCQYLSRVKFQRINKTFDLISNLILKIDYFKIKGNTEILIILNKKLTFHYLRLESIYKRNRYSLAKEYLIGNYKKQMSGFKSFLIDII